MTNTEPKQYEVTTIADLVDVVNLENVDALSVDIANFLKTLAGTYGLERIMSPTECEGKKNSEIATCTKFVWIDDGKHEMTVTVHSTPAE